MSDCSTCTFQKWCSYGIERDVLTLWSFAQPPSLKLPDNVQIRKEALLAVSKSSTIFISYLAAVADELAKQSSRKTISAADVIEGLGLMEFPEEIRTQLRKEVKEFRSLEQAKKKKAQASAAGEGGGAAETITAPGAGEEDDEDDEGDEDAGDNAGMATREEEGQAGLDKDADLEQPPARPQGELDVDEEDEDREERMVAEGAEEGDEEDEEMGDDR